MGSSMVMMCSARSLLILSTMAASVVDLPDPVGPVTSTRPLGRSASSCTTFGRPSSSKDRILYSSEEHTSELQSRQYLVCRLLLEKKNKFNAVVVIATPVV